MKVFLVKQESNCDGEILFNVTPCKDMETAKKVMEDEVKTLLTESVHYDGIDIDNVDENGDFTLNIDAGNSLELVLTIVFTEDDSKKRRIETNLSDNHLIIMCINFVSLGTGLTAPLEVALIDGKKIYFMFWAYLEGNAENKTKARKVEYTLYSE